MENKERKRYDGLDQLRGILAFTVMIYHYLSWQDVDLFWAIQKPLDLMGLYAVSTFYVLSGCALYIVYHNTQLDRSFMMGFWVKRSLRIVPLFWLVTTVTILFSLIQSGEVSGWKVFLNYSLLFSWADPAAYISTGAWSIGNEWAFYMIFPLLIWGLKTKFNMLVIVIPALAIACYYWFFILTPHRSVASQWSVYVMPMNQFPLFLGGFLIGTYVMAPKWAASFNNRILCLATLIFVMYSYFFTTADSIYGWSRVILVLIALLWCYCFGAQRIFNRKTSIILNWLGMISYTLYLVHPLVIRVARKLLEENGHINQLLGMNAAVSNVAIVVISIGVTLLVSHYIYMFLEKPMIILGKRKASEYRSQKVDGFIPNK